ncbi:MAG: endonuclease/exonuclease/phosphatase family protein [Bryobacterales bacterium]
MPVEQREERATPDEIRRIIREELRPHFRELATLGSTPELLASPIYQRLRPRADVALNTPEVGAFGPDAAPEKASYRLVAWNLERGIHCDAQLEALRMHPHMRDADVLLLTETDVGMARSGNRNIARELAEQLGMHYAFSPCYLNLAKGSGVEYDVTGENDLGLHGNAILSRYPLRNVRPVALKNGKDKMKGREKRLGRQTAVVAEVELPQGAVSFASVHLDANSSQPHRRDQMRDVLDGIGPDKPAVVGGDWNTTTYNSSTATDAILGFWVRVFMGPDNVIRNHYLHPYNKFEKDLFALLEERGFDYRNSNSIGERTTSYDVDDAKTHKNLREWVPAWCFAFIRWALRNHDGKCPLKIDWFAVRGLQSSDPRVFHEFREGRQPPLSDHDPIAVDVAFR